MNNIIAKFIREENKYTRNQLKELFELNDDEIDIFISKLCRSKVLKMIKKDKEDLNLLNVEFDFKSKDIMARYNYSVKYVGVIIIDSRVIICYPKYLEDVSKPMEEMKLILKVLKRYNADQQEVNLYNSKISDENFNMLSLILFIINDYYESGIYNKSQRVTTLNGEGEANWDQIIDKTVPMIMKNRPYYFDMYFEQTIDDEKNYFKRLHEYILTECFKKLRKFGVDELFEIDYIELSEEELECFGSEEYILYKLESEYNVEFDDRNKILINAMHNYISNKNSFEEDIEFIMFGTYNFKFVWQEVCSTVFGNHLKMRVKDLGLRSEAEEMMLVDMIEKPIWIGIENEEKKFEEESRKTLIPDIVMVNRYNDDVSLVILDAKYYNIKFKDGEKIDNYPGISDVTKQYFYELAYKKLIKDNNIKHIHNCFLFPSSDSSVQKKGIVRMKMFKELELQDIQLVFVSAELAYNNFLKNKYINVNIEEL